MAHIAPHAPGPGLVLGRAVVLGAVGLGSGIASHVAGGGRLPSGTVLLLLLLVSIAASTSLLRTWASTGRLVAVVLVAQGGWHLVLSLLAGHAGDAPARGTTDVPAVPLVEGRRTGSLHDVYLASTPGAGTASPGSEGGLVQHQIAHLAEQGVAMVVAHLVGAALLGVFLARGEAALRSLASLVVDFAGAVLYAGAWCGVRALVRLRISAAVQPAVGPVRRLVLGSVSRRGPPFVLMA